MKSSPQYSSLSSNTDSIIEDVTIDCEAKPHFRLRQAGLYLAVALASAAITALVFGVVLVGQKNDRSEAVIDNSCGHSVEEALTNGCHFDMMASTWETPECHDADLLEEVLTEGPWQWYRDAEHKELVPRGEVALGEFPILPFYPDSNYHIGHCMYMWRKQHRAYLRGMAISEDLWDYNHTAHCAKLVLRENWPLLGRTQAGFSVCRTAAAWRRLES